MGLFADLLGRYASNALLFALRDSTAGAPPDGKTVPLQAGASGGLKVEATTESGDGLATEAKQDAQIARMPVPIDSPPLADQFAVPTRQVGAVDVVVVGAPSQQTAVDPGLGSGLPVRTTLDDRFPSALEQDKVKVSLGLSGESGTAHIGTEAAPIAVRGSDGTAFHQLALDHTRADDYHAARITDGTDFIVPAKTEQLPEGLEATRLAVSLGLAGAELSATNPAAVRPSDGTQFATNTSRISSANSSTTPLGAGATFTGTYEEVTQYATVSVQVRADVVSGTNGLAVEFSTDGANLDNDDTFTIPAANGKVFTFGANARYMRVRYTNGAAPQGFFRLQTIYHHVPPKPSSHKLTVDLVDEDDAELVRAVLAAKKPDGTYTNITADADGNLIVTTPSQAAEDSGFIFGRVVLASTTPTPIRATAYTEQAANAQRSIVSTSANDTAAGTGARAVRVRYLPLDMSGTFEEIVPTNGLTPVNMVATNVCFIESMDVPLNQFGSGLTNAGTLSLKAAAGGGGATIWSIATGDKQAFGAHHYVRPGRSARLTGFACGIKGADTAGFEVRTSDPTSPTPQAEVVVSDHLRCPAGAQAPMRIYSSPIEIDGPARLTIYVLPDSTSSRTYYASSDYFEVEE